MEEVKKPIVVENNKPLTRIEKEDDAKKSLNTAATEPNQEIKKSKKKKQKNKGNNFTVTSISEPAPQSISEKDIENEPNKPSNSNEPLKPEQSKPKAPQQQSKSVVPNKIPTIKFQAKPKDPLKKVAHKTIDKKNKQNKTNTQKSKGLSDERLKAFGINPKKFSKQQKYASHNKQPNANKSNNPIKKFTPQQKNKLKNKLKKVLQS